MVWDPEASPLVLACIDRHHRPMDLHSCRCFNERVLVGLGVLVLVLGYVMRRFERRNGGDGDAP